MPLRWTEERYQEHLAKMRGDPPAPPAKAHKYRAQRVTIDGHVFPSKWEGQCYTELRWQYLAGLITEPLLQVRFALGLHYGRMRFYVADLVHVDLATGMLVVTEAKGYRTPTYKQKKPVFEALYGIPICERLR